jgi:hypothetical protein
VTATSGDRASTARQQTLRATEGSDGLVSFAFPLESGDCAEWDICPLLQQAPGDAAEHEAKAWDRMVLGEQVGATFQTLEF